jgi:hypothetical protein
MTMRRRTIAGIALLLLLQAYSIAGMSRAVYAQSTEVIEQVGANGKINWSTGTAEATGTGTAPERYYGRPQARVMAQRSAQLDAYRNLLETVKGIRVDTALEVKDFISISETVRTKIEELVKGAQIVRRDYLADGTVEVTLRMSLRGDFAERILPIVSPGLKSVAPAPASVRAVPSATAATGLVVDARGIQARAAMFPRIVDENDQDVYGFMMVDRDYAVQIGMSGYAKDPSVAQSNPKVAANPITVKGIKTNGPGRVSIVISNSDAQTIRDSADSAGFMKKAKVIIVLD